jgi:hypothetical protein
MKSLRKLRRDLHWSLREVQTLTGYIQDYLSEIERGITLPVELMRERLRLSFREQINFLNVPILKASP